VMTPGKSFDTSVMWWKHEALHREIIKDYPNRIKIMDRELQDLQAEFLSKEAEIKDRPGNKRAEFSAACFAAVDKAENDWLEKVKETSFSSKNHFYYTMAWKKLNQQAEMPN